jgi:hypothetical protein
MQCFPFAYRSMARDNSYFTDRGYLLHFGEHAITCSYNESLNGSVNLKLGRQQDSFILLEGSGQYRCQCPSWESGYWKQYSPACVPLSSPPAFNTTADISLPMDEEHLRESLQRMSTINSKVSGCVFSISISITNTPADIPVASTPSPMTIYSMDKTYSECINNQETYLQREYLNLYAKAFAYKAIQHLVRHETLLLSSVKPQNINMLPPVDAVKNTIRRTLDEVNNIPLLPQEDVIWFNAEGGSICLLKSTIFKFIPDSQLAVRLNGDWKEQSSTLDEQGHIKLVSALWQHDTCH